MTIYYVLIILILLAALLLHGERARNTAFILIAVALLFCVYGFRDAEMIGHDSSSSYLHQFQRLEGTSWDEMPTIKDWLSTDQDDANDTSDTDDYRIGHERNFAFRWLMKAVYDLTDGDYQFFITIIAVFVMVVFAQFIYRYSPSPAQSILYYFGLMYYTMMFSVLKQSIAMAFILLAFNAITDRKLFRFVILVLVASMFHFPAIAFLPAYWIARMRPGRTYILLLAALLVLTYVFRDQIVRWAQDTYETNLHDASTTRFLANKVIVMLVIIIAAVVIRPPSAEDTVYCSILMLIGIAAVLQTYAGYSNNFERLADYYFQLSVVFIPMVFENVKTKRRYLSERELALVRRAGPYLFGAFAIWRFLNTISGDSAFNPYQFYFQAEKAGETLAAWANLL